MRDEGERTKGEYQVGTGLLAIDRSDFYQYRDALVKEMISVTDSPVWSENLKGFYLGKYVNRYGSVVHIVGSTPAPLKKSVIKEFEEAQ